MYTCVPAVAIRNYALATAMLTKCLTKATTESNNSNIFLLISADVQNHHAPTNLTP